MQNCGSIPSIGHAGIDGVHRNSALRKVGRRAPCELMERSFTGDIRQFTGHGPAMLTRREEHNASSWASIMLCRECLRQQQGGAHIRMQMPIYFVRCEPLESSQGGQDSCCFPKGNVAVFLLETKMTGL